METDRDCGSVMVALGKESDLSETQLLLLWKRGIPPSGQVTARTGANVERGRVSGTSAEGESRFLDRGVEGRAWLSG